MNEYYKLTPEEAEKQELFFRELHEKIRKDNIKKEILENIDLISDKELLKEISKRKLNAGYPIGALENVSTTKLKEELRRRKQFKI